MAGKAWRSIEAVFNVLSVARVRWKSLAEIPQQVLEVLSTLNLFYSISFSCWTYACPGKTVFQGFFHRESEAAAFHTDISASCWTSALLVCKQWMFYSVITKSRIYSLIKVLQRNIVCMSKTQDIGRIAQWISLKSSPIAVNMQTLTTHKL